MALKLAIATQYGATWSNCYWRPTEVKFNDMESLGYLKIRLYKDEAARIAQKQYHTINLYLKSSEETDGDVTTALKFADVWGKTKAQMYALLKTKKVYFEGIIYDISQAVNV